MKNDKGWVWIGFMVGIVAWGLLVDQNMKGQIRAEDRVRHRAAPEIVRMNTELAELRRRDANHDQDFLRAVTEARSMAQSMKPKQKGTGDDR